MSAETSSRAGRWAARLATVLLLPLFSVALVAVLFEGILRLAGYEAIYETYSKPTLFWMHDALLGWSHEPDARGEYVGPRPWPIEFRGRVEINSLGLRGPEIPPPDPGEARVLVMGDSMVAAFEVDYPETFTARLEELLRERVPTPVRVINGGVRGYGTDQSYLFFRDKGARLGPKLVVFFHSGNDRLNNVTLHEMRRPFGKPAFALHGDGRLELRGSPVPRYPMCSEVRLSERFEVVRVDGLVDRLACQAQLVLFDRSALASLLSIVLREDSGLLRSLYELGAPDDGRRSAPKSGARSDPATRLTMALLLELYAQARSLGADFFVIGFPDHLSQLDAQALLDAGIETHPLDKIADAPQEEVRWHHDSHLNPEGHRRLALELLPLVEARLP